MPTFRMSAKEADDFEREWLARGATVGARAALTETVPAKAQEPAQDAPSEALAEAGISGGFGRIEAVVPLKTASEVNQREWRGRSGRTKRAWNAVSRLFGPRLWHLADFGLAYSKGRPLYVRFVRLGGRKIDRSNLPSATKAVEDALAYFLGADDGDPRWHPSWAQEPGGLCGVRIVLSMEPLSAE